MRLSEPRVQPLEEAKWDPEIVPWLRGLSKDGSVSKILRTLAHHPKLYKRWRAFANHILMKSQLPSRDREILILRTGWNCQAGYEWGQHEPIGKAAGLTDDEILRIAKGPGADGWDPFEAALLRAADELRGDAFISDATWGVLAERYSDQQMIDVVFTVGQYNMIAMALNSFGVQLEEGYNGLPQ